MPSGNKKSTRDERIDNSQCESHRRIFSHDLDSKILTNTLSLTKTFTERPNSFLSFFTEASIRSDMCVYPNIWVNGADVKSGQRQSC